MRTKIQNTVVAAAPLAMETKRQVFAQSPKKKWSLKSVGALVAVLAISFLVPTAFAQQPVDFLYFVSQSNSSVAVGNIDYGRWTQNSILAPDPYVPPGLTHVVNTANGILLYNAQTGSAIVEQIKPNGTRFVGSAYTFSAGWEKIVSIGEFIYFYKSDGSASIGYITPNAQYVATKTYGPGWFSYWSQVISTDSYLFFYNANSGAMSVGWITPQGTFQGTGGFPSSTLTSFSYGVSNGHFILLYNQQTGASWFGKISSTGQFISSVAGPSPLPPGCNKLVAHNRYLLLYNSNTGAGIIGYIGYVGSSDQFIVTQQPAFAPYWTRIVSTNDNLFFYNSVTGSAAVGHINGNGQFQQTQVFSGSPGWFGIVATAR